MALLDNLPILNMFSNAQENMMQGFHNFGQQMVNNAQWKRQNKYNAPKAQMARLKEAGLNPNLVYGNGIATQPAAQMPSMMANQTRSADIADSFMKTQQIKQSQAQTDNLQAQNQVINQELLLKLAQTVLTQTENEKKKFDLAFAGDLRNTNLDYRKQQLNKLYHDIQFTANEDERKAMSNVTSIQEATARIAQIRGITLNNEVQRAILNEDVKLKKLGLQPSDEWYWRIASKILENKGNPSKFKSVNENNLLKLNH